MHTLPTHTPPAPPLLSPIRAGLRAFALLCLWTLGGAAGPARAEEDGWARTLREHRTPTGVRYAAVAAAKPLDAYLASLATAVEPTEPAAKMAFWINAYNALTVDLVADNWPLASIRDLDGGQPWKRRSFVVAGRSLSLDHIEHQILRPMGDPRVHAALNCASRGCPPLAAAPFTAAGLNAELEAVTQAWIRGGGARLNRTTKQLELSAIFDWFGEDFARSPAPPVPGLTPKASAIAGFVARYSSPEDAAALRAGGYALRTLPYDWSVNLAR